MLQSNRTEHIDCLRRRTVHYTRFAFVYASRSLANANNWIQRRGHLLIATRVFTYRQAFFVPRKNAHCHPSAHATWVNQDPYSAQQPLFSCCVLYIDPMAQLEQIPNGLAMGTYQMNQHAFE